jgi:hypothetical protein
MKEGFHEFWYEGTVDPFQRYGNLFRRKYWVPRDDLFAFLCASRDGAGGGGGYRLNAVFVRMKNVYYPYIRFVDKD